MKIVLKASDFSKVTKNLAKADGSLVMMLSSSAFTIQTSQEAFSFTAAEESECGVDAKIVSAQLASDFVNITKKLSKKGLITITIQENTMQFRDENGGGHSLYVEKSSEHFQPVVSENVVILQQKDLLRALTSVKNSVAKYDVRYFLNSILFSFKSGLLTLSATDGARLSIAEPIQLECSSLDGDYIVMDDGEHGAIKSLVDTLERTGESVVSLSTDYKRIKFETDRTVFHGVLCTGINYPDLPRFVPKCPRGGVTINVKNLLAICKKLLPHLDKSKGVDLVAKGGELSLSPYGDKINSFSLAYEGNAFFSQSMNCTFLRQALESITQDTCVISLEKKRSGFLIQAGRHIQVVMPFSVR